MARKRGAGGNYMGRSVDRQVDGILAYTDMTGWELWVIMKRSTNEWLHLKLMAPAGVRWQRGRRRSFWIEYCRPEGRLKRSKYRRLLEEQDPALLGRVERYLAQHFRQAA